MNLQRASGRIENLRVVEDKRNVLFGPQMQEAAGLSAIIFAAAGMGGAAVQTSMNSDTADDVALYSFNIGGVRYAGCTREATFKDGDEVEVVFEAKRGGNEVLCVRRPSTRSIWLYPYMSRGTRAGWRHAVKVWLLASAVASVVLMMIFGLFLVVTGFSWLLFGLGLAGTVLLLLIFLGVIGAVMAPKFIGFARAANEVFAAFGYPDPKNVDLHKTSKAHRKAHNLANDSSFELWY
jgi:hypothetical protein